MGQRLVPYNQLLHLVKRYSSPVKGAESDIPHTSNHRVVAGIQCWHEIVRSVLRLRLLHSHGKAMGLFVFLLLRPLCIGCGPASRPAPGYAPALSAVADRSKWYRFSSSAKSCRREERSHTASSKPRPLSAEIRLVGIQICRPAHGKVELHILPRRAGSKSLAVSAADIILCGVGDIFLPRLPFHRYPMVFILWINSSRLWECSMAVRISCRSFRFQHGMRKGSALASVTESPCSCTAGWSIPWPGASPLRLW